MQHKLPPNFLAFFNKELKRWTEGKAQLGTDPKQAIVEMTERAKAAIQKDLDAKNIVDGIMRPPAEDEEEDPQIIKESGSEHPIK